MRRENSEWNEIVFILAFPMCRRCRPSAVPAESTAARFDYLGAERLGCQHGRRCGLRSGRQSTLELAAFLRDYLIICETAQLHMRTPFRRPLRYARFSSPSWRMLVSSALTSGACGTSASAAL